MQASYPVSKAAGGPLRAEQVLQVGRSYAGRNRVIDDHPRPGKLRGGNAGRPNQNRGFPPHASMSRGPKGFGLDFNGRMERKTLIPHLNVCQPINDPRARDHRTGRVQG